MIQSVITNEVYYDQEMGCQTFSVLVVRPSTEPFVVSFPILFDESIPLDKAFYDYFNSGNFYVNPSSAVSFNSYRDHFPTVYTKYVTSHTDFNTIDFDNQDSISAFNAKYDWIDLYFHPTREDSFGFIFALDFIFDYNKPQQLSPICKNFTFSEKGKENIQIISKKYAYANVIQDSPICSHEEVSINDTFTHCSFGLSKQTKCHYYEPVFEVIRTARHYSPVTSELEAHFSLTYFNSYTYHVFVIKNEITNSDITRLNFPTSSEHSLEELTEEAIKFFSEIIEPYPNIDLTLSAPPLDSSSQSPSYISHLLSEDQFSFL